MNHRYALIPFPNQNHPDITMFSEVIIKNHLITLTYHIAGDLSDLIIPHFDSFKEGHDLWKNTCMECFILLEDGQSYIELNFSPSGLWHIYYFDDYRQPSSKLKNLVDIKMIEVTQTINSFILNAQFNFSSVFFQAMGLSAVIEDRKNLLSYFALKHSAKQPDFHQSASFILNQAMIADRV
jgi:hypothetical protein